MNKKNDIDQMLENMLNENHVEDNGFTEKIVERVSRQPRVVYLTNAAPLLGGVFGLILFALAKDSFSNMDFSSFMNIYGQGTHLAHQASAVARENGKMIGVAAVLIFSAVMYFKKEEA